MFDYGKNLATMSIDGNLVFSLDGNAMPSQFHTGSGSLPTTGAQIRVGFRAWGGENTVYYDDVAVGYEPIGCQQ